jgi:hypothetical protein
MAAVAALLVVRHYRFARYASWYGFRLGQDVSEIRNIGKLSRSGDATLLNVPEPWSQVVLSFDSAHKLNGLHFYDQGLVFEECDVAPCPSDRLKTVEQIRKEGQELRKTLMQRLGRPVSDNRFPPDREVLRWTYARLQSVCEAGRSIDKPPLSDPTGKLDSIELDISDDSISLVVNGKGWDERFHKSQDGLPSLVVAPAPPCD